MKSHLKQIDFRPSCVRSELRCFGFFFFVVGLIFVRLGDEGCKVQPQILFRVPRHTIFCKEVLHVLLNHLQNVRMFVATTL